MVFTLYRRLCCLQKLIYVFSIFKTQSTKLEVFDNILYNFRISNTLQLHIFLILKSLRMATSTSKKREIEEENRSFKIEWEIKYFFVEDSGKYICLV